jgi:hypothetical protein
MKNIWAFYISVLAMMMGFLCSISNKTASPEALIVGQWEETQWQYEQKGFDENINHVNELKQLARRDLMIHQAETWHFLPDGTLQLCGKDSTRQVKWLIKGRGHILQLKHEDGNWTENYNIDILDSNTLIVNFETDIEAKGLAKLTFKKPNKYVHVTQVQ